MAGLLLACLPLYHVHAVFSDHNPWPRRFLAGIAALAGIRISTSGARAGMGEFFLGNHVSWIDVPALAAVSGGAFVAHDGLIRFRVLRWLCDMNDTVFVARHDRASIAAQIAKVREALSETGTLIVFPEGTTSDGTGLLPFKSSLLSALAGAPAGTVVQPVLLDYGPQAADIAWVGEEPGLDNFLRILARRKPVAVTIVFLEPLAGEALADRKSMAIAARAAIAAEMDRRHSARAVHSDRASGVQRVTL